jgi:hypothetical protein
VHAANGIRAIAPQDIANIVRRFTLPRISDQYVGGSARHF